MTKEKTLYHITLDEAKQHLRIDSGETSYDTEITSLIQTAYQICENYIAKDIAKTTTTLNIYDFSGSEIEIGEGNYISISGITDEDGNDLSYVVKKVYNSSFIIELDNDVNNKDITVVYITGYNENKLPSPIKQAILMKISDLYDTERTSYITTGIKKNDSIELLLNPYVWNGIKYIRN